MSSNDDIDSGDPLVSRDEEDEAPFDPHTSTAVKIAQEPKTEEEIQARVDMLMSGDRTEEFLVELERKMICGYSYRQRRLWAKLEFDVDDDTVSQIEHLLRHAHKLETLHPPTIFAKRHLQIQRHLVVFQKALEAEDFKEANKSLDSISKIEGLMAPDTTVNVNLTGAAEVTSRTRERLTDLLETARRKYVERQDILRKGRLKIVETTGEELKEAK